MFCCHFKYGIDNLAKNNDKCFMLFIILINASYNFVYIVCVMCIYELFNYIINYMEN